MFNFLVKNDRLGFPFRISKLCCNYFCHFELRKTDFCGLLSLFFPIFFFNNYCFFFFFYLAIKCFPIEIDPRSMARDIKKCLKWSMEAYHKLATVLFSLWNALSPVPVKWLSAMFKLHWFRNLHWFRILNIFLFETWKMISENSRKIASYQIMLTLDIWCSESGIFLIQFLKQFQNQSNVRQWVKWQIKMMSMRVTCHDFKRKA